MGSTFHFFLHVHRLVHVVELLEGDPGLRGLAPLPGQIPVERLERRERGVPHDGLPDSPVDVCWLHWLYVVASSAWGEAERASPKKPLMTFSQRANPNTAHMSRLRPVKAA